MFLRLLLLFLLGGAALAGEPVTTDTLKWFTPDRDFKPIDPAAWVYEGVQKTFAGDFANPKSLPYVDELAAAGVTVIHTGGPEPYYPLRRDGGPGMEESALMRAAFERMRSHGIRIVIGVSPYAPAEYVKAHREWRLKPSPDEKPLDPALDLNAPANIPFRSLSLNTPYGDYLIENLAEIFADYHVDGISFDGNYHPPLNYTPYDMELYVRETGRAFPRKIDIADDDYKIYLLWADTKLENWYRKLHARLREVNPQAAIYTWTTNAGRYGHFLTNPRVMSARMNLLFDSPVQEWWLDEVNLGASVVPAFGAAYVRALTGGRTGASEPYIISRGNPYSSSSFPRHELFVRCMMAMTNGSITPLAVPTAAGKVAGDDTLREIGRRKKWFIRSTPEPWAALLVSEQTRQFYAGGHIMERFLAHALGVFRVGCEEHLPITLITDLDLRPERLAPYKVLILPNAAALSDGQVAAIREYVKSGGGLVATCETSLFDELGHPRPNFALSDLFGVDYHGRPKAPAQRAELDANFAIVVNESYWANRQGTAEMRWGAGDILTSELIADPRMEHLTNGVQASFKGPLVLMSPERGPMKRAMIMFPEGKDPVPAVVMGEHDKGRVVYMAAGFDAANYSYGYPYERIIFSRAIQWAANVPMPVAVQAPMCVQSTLFRQKDAAGERLVVHLFNGINTTSDHGLPETDVPLREEVLPIAGIKVRFHWLNLKRVHLEPEAMELPVVTEGEWSEVCIPSLPVHSMVVAEF
ncbi:MAG: Trehalose utilization [Chthoniobacteraceae bacterium]|nr:Trehalose utilization [Chthoniobacteraceae bacterium]